MTTTNDILRNALYAGAKATDEIAPGQGKHMRKFADELYPELRQPESVSAPRVVNDLIAQVRRMFEREAYHYCADCKTHCRQTLLTVEALKESERLRDNDDGRVQTLYEALRRAKETIRTFNGLGMKGETEQACWDAYQHSPEMKQINAALAAVEGENS